jgi:hypothetical protein
MVLSVALHAWPVLAGYPASTCFHIAWPRVLHPSQPCGSKARRTDCIMATTTYPIVRRQMVCLIPGRYPLDMVRGRLTIQAGKGDHYSGIMHATRSIIRDVRPFPFVPGVPQPPQPVS